MMGVCHEIQLQLTEYAGGDLLPAEAAEVARHLDGCPACRRELALENSLRTTLGSLPRVTCPEGVGRADEEPTSHPIRRWTRWPVGAGLVAAASLAALLIGGLIDRSVDPDPAAPWSAREIAAAREDMLYTLALTAEVLERTQREAVVDVFGDRLPGALNGSLKLKSLPKGDEG